MIVAGVLWLRFTNEPAYEASAAREDFAGVTYHDPDGTPFLCCHTEQARQTRPGVQAVDVADELASRRQLEGWTVSI